MKTAILKYLDGMTAHQCEAPDEIPSNKLTAYALEQYVEDRKYDSCPSLDLRNADLSGIDLSDRKFVESDFSGASLVGANLTGSDFDDANLHGADLSGAKICSAEFSKANLCEVKFGREIPFIQDIDVRIHDAIGEDGAYLDMGIWHDDTTHCGTAHCGTAHCRAGWAVHLAGDAGYDLERDVGPCAAGAMIYAVSRPERAVPNFYASDGEALADIEKCAGEQRAANATKGAEQEPV